MSDDMEGGRATRLRDAATVMSRRARQAEERVVHALKGTMTTSAAQEMVGHLVARIFEHARAEWCADQAELAEDRTCEDQHGPGHFGEDGRCSVCGGARAPDRQNPEVRAQAIVVLEGERDRLNARLLEIAGAPYLPDDVRDAEIDGERRGIEAGLQALTLVDAALAANRRHRAAHAATMAQRTGSVPVDGTQAAELARRARAAANQGDEPGEEA